MVLIDKWLAWPNGDKTNKTNVMSIPSRNIYSTAKAFFCLPNGGITKRKTSVLADGKNFQSVRKGPKSRKISKR